MNIDTNGLTPDDIQELIKKLVTENNRKKYFFNRQLERIREEQKRTHQSYNHLIEILVEENKKNEQSFDTLIKRLNIRVERKEVNETS